MIIDCLLVKGKSSLPLQIAIFVLVPELYGIDDVLPYNVGARSNYGDRIKEGVHEPYSYYIVLLSQCLSAIYTLTPNAADGLAEGEKDDAYDQWQ